MIKRMKRVILLQTIATNSKNGFLKSFMNTAISECCRLLSERKGCNTFMQFHHKTLSASKKRTFFNVQVRCSLIRDAWKKKAKRVRGLTVKFNVSRNCKTFKTKLNFFIKFGLYPRQRIAIPIKQNRNYQRFQSLTNNGWLCKTFGLTKGSQVVAYLSKEKDVLERKNVMGIDINAKHFAVTVISSKGAVLYQTYFGKHIWNKRKKIWKRRGLLQALAAKSSTNAKILLRRLEKREKNFTNTNIGQIIKEITNLAIKHDANIAIEKLRQFTPRGRHFNKNVMCIPFFQFRRILESRCFDKDIKLKTVDGWHTSKWCSHCGAVGNGHSANYSLFKCKDCGQVVNSDRKASLAVAVKSLLEREGVSQFSKWRGSVNNLVRPDEMDLRDAVHQNQSMNGKPALWCG